MTREEERLIERWLPVADLGEETRLEKPTIPPIFRLLFWWTRKPLVASRAAVLGALLPGDYDRNGFSKELGLGREKRAFNYSPRIRNLVHLYETFFGKKPKVLDPFAGGGSIPFEAVRLGVDVTALEYNPVAYLLLLSTLQYPKQYGEKLAKDVDTWGNQVLKLAKDEISFLYPKHEKMRSSAYVWCWVARCKRCGQRNPLVATWGLSRKKNIGMKPILLDNGDFEIEFTKNPTSGTVERAKSTCLKCQSPITNEHIRSEVSAGRRKLLCVVMYGREGLKFEKPSEDDFNALAKAETLLKEKWKYFEKLDLIPTEDMPKYELNRVVPYGFDKWSTLFSSRQLLAILTFCKYILTLATEIEKQKGKEYAKVISTYLALTLAQHVRFNSLPTVWDQANTKIGHALSFRRPGMTWNHAEVNPFAQKGSGTWRSMLNSIVHAITFAAQCLTESGEIQNQYGSVFQLPFEKDTFDLVVTDPPYLDDVPYGELSEFYHVWLWRLLNRFHPDLPGPKVPVDEELDHSPGRRGSGELSRAFYEAGLTKAFEEMGRVLRGDGLLVAFFAHSRLEAWKMLISSLVTAGFNVTMTWPLHTERPGSVVQRGKASIQSSILVAARKRENGGTAFIEDLRDEVSSHVMKSLAEVSDLELTGADLIVAGLGKALEVATSYSKLKSYSGNATLESLLEVVSHAVYSYSVEKLLDTTLAALDPQTAFYVFVKCGYGGFIPPDDALMICKGAGLELQALQHDKIVEKKKLGTRTILATLNAYERALDLENPPKIPSILDQLHLLELAVKKDGKAGFNRLVSSPTFRAGDVRAVAEGLYNGLLLIKKADPEIELLRPIIDLYKTGAPTPPQKTIDKYFTSAEKS